ncbi:MAG: class I SAM-dependent methyltransferase [Bacteroidia bacterium]|nr:class I SAM-dependent methyltransferase [Bacteroidia bacterium]MCZ2276790.1 class I SAM-dependent methyltransferase [Bacteroidia bacterium]
MEDWFKLWFDSPYYHILYKNRSVEEAKAFLISLVNWLKPAQNSAILDQACGHGRHALLLNEMGFNVTGIDLSENNIAYCKQFENDKLNFSVHDMRRILATNVFDYVLNLFTSMGYFRYDHDQQLTVSSAAVALKRKGRYIIDFMNAEKVRMNLVPEVTRKVEGIEFKIRKRFEDNFLIKEISFADEGKSYRFSEHVEVLKIEDFDRYFKKAGLKQISVFGNYHLDPFDLKTSDRLILIAEKL